LHPVVGAVLVGDNVAEDVLAIAGNEKLRDLSNVRTATGRRVVGDDESTLEL